MPVTVMSAGAGRDTASLKLAVNLMRSEFVGFGSLVSIVPVGGVVSIVIVTGLDATLPLPTELVATSAAIETITVPSDAPRVTSKLYEVPLPMRLDADAPDVPSTVISVMIKSSTGSSNVTVNGIVVRVVGEFTVVSSVVEGPFVLDMVNSTSVVSVALAVSVTVMVLDSVTGVLDVTSNGMSPVIMSLLIER